MENTGLLQISSTEKTMILGVLVIAIAGLLYAVFLARQILGEPKGSKKMQEVWNYIRTGANAYLQSQLRTIAILIVVLVAVLFLSVYIIKPSPFSIEQFCPALANQAQTDYYAKNPGAEAILKGTDVDKASDVRSDIEAAIAGVGDQCSSAR